MCCGADALLPPRVVLFLGFSLIDTSLLLLSGTIFQLTRRYDFSAARFRD